MLQFIWEENLLDEPKKSEVWTVENIVGDMPQFCFKRCV